MFAQLQPGKQCSYLPKRRGNEIGDEQAMAVRALYASVENKILTDGVMLDEEEEKEEHEAGTCEMKWEVANTSEIKMAYFFLGQKAHRPSTENM